MVSKCVVFITLWLITTTPLANACPFRPLGGVLEPIRVEVLGSSGLTGVFYDLDGNGQADRALVFPPDLSRANGLTYWPLIYFEGLNEEGHAEEVWIDRGGDGECIDIYLYWKRTVRY